MKEVAIQFTDMAQTIFQNQRFDLPVKIICGCYRNAINAFIARDVFSFPDMFLIYFNAYYIEFFMDFLAVALFPQSISYKEVFSKYSKNYIDFGSSNPSYLFYAGNCPKREYSSPEFSQLLQLSSVGALFTMFHEYGHLNTDLLNATMALTEDDALTKHIDKLSLKQATETSCDFIAMKLIDDLDVSSKFGCLPEDALMVSLLALPMYELYNMVVQGVIDNTNSGFKIDGSQKIIDNFNKRVAPFAMMVKISQNSGWGFKNSEISAAISRAGKYIYGFMNEFAKYIQELPQEIEAWNNSIEENKNKISVPSVYCNSTDETWVYYN